ncbi:MULTISPECIES: sensor histidine kinase [Mesonia]|uniref:Phytochrome-like protein cph1 n=1 Tax=Mesonia oceanica TaxID=2687242 RepID=A0AC61Y5W4_9FLAO|nr:MULTISPECIES: ATP-binding protein [Mesonia]MAN27732.1 two-component sensor histidine kinase [Mesonia sp.]MAQ39665.1 two-component sensor histidine kinase [Mesonia sp.]VVU99574.1 Phytochrome-like protein cph1 [Mesonia oceanica]|tara:strand:- start:38393 stop:39424 length:1032 start_codon:yes stop_codon:yes gene_type:complete
MSTLLERQIRKFLPQDLANNESLKPFLEAVKKSYHTQEEQFNMLQRAMQISSEELFVANQKLREESKAQQEILDSLKLVIKSLQLKTPQKNENLDVIELANYLKEQSEELNKVREEQETLLKSLENKNEILSNYAHMVSHDLKSPLRNINTLLNFILEEKPELASQCKEYISLILNNLEKMDALINGILNYSTLDKEQFGKEVIDLNLLLTQLTEVIYIPEHIELQVPKNFPTIYGDTVRIQQIFQNILQNAINSIEKEKGLIKIDYKDRENFWEFSIKDNGYGIPQHQFEKIFRIFEKIDNDQQATGIGLSIVKKIIDFYEGKIWLESELDKGTTFYFTLPK